MKYLFLDTETGGLGLDKSLLTLYMEVTDEKFNSVGFFDLLLKPDDEVYRVTGGGMSVNGINLAEHDKNPSTITYKKAGQELYLFLKWQKEEGSHLIPVGHGVDGDIRHIQDKLVSRSTWESFCSHRYLDTSSICKYLQLCGKLDENLSGSLESLKDHLGLKEKSHTADGDVRVVKEVLKYFKRLLK